VIEGDKARVRAVQVGQQEGDNVQIVTGVNAGETVATSNLQQLFDGVSVRRQ
jgi:multidrug efflux pump subunit AcrA (membrane-fusion protein)